MLKVIIPTWIALGFYRGVKYFNYNYNKQCIRYEKNKNDTHYTQTKPKYFYAECFGSGIFGLIIYINPVLLPITFSKEIYRLEVNIRGMNEEKQKKEYYELL